MKRFGRFSQAGSQKILLRAVSKLLYLALRNIAKKWTLPVRDWRDALNRFGIIYENRLPASAELKKPGSGNQRKTDYVFPAATQKQQTIVYTNP